MAWYIARMLGERIKHERESQGITRKELGAAAGVSET